MDQQTIEDLLAFITVRNVTLAAKRRHLSQSAYSRRLQAIERMYGIELFDRSRRPAQPTPSLDSMQGELEMALNTLKRIGKRLSSKIQVDGHLSIAAMHSLSTGALPIALRMVADRLANHRIRLRSANRDGCFQMLMTEEVSVVVAYESSTQLFKAPANLVATTGLGSDPFVPVCTPELYPLIMSQGSADQALPLVSYPSDVFLGSVLNNDVLARCPFVFSHRLTSGMTSVVLSAVLNSIGMGWLPLSIVSDNFKRNRLVLIEHPAFPLVDLQVTMLRLRTPDMRSLDSLYDALGRAVGDALITLQ